jgi:hypothetical protein
MQRKPIGVGDPPAGSVRGLGVCDALELELLPVQVPWLIDQLEELRGPLEEQLQREVATEPADEGRVEAIEYGLRLLRLIRESLPSSGSTDAVRFVGPSGMVERVARGTLVDAASTVSELAAADPLDLIALRDALAAAAAWATSLLACTQVTGYGFDPEADPAQQW